MSLKLHGLLMLRLSRTRVLFTLVIGCVRGTWRVLVLAKGWKDALVRNLLLLLLFDQMLEALLLASPIEHVTRVLSSKFLLGLNLLYWCCHQLTLFLLSDLVRSYLLLELQLVQLLCIFR